MRSVPGKWAPAVWQIFGALTVIFAACSALLDAPVYFAVLTCGAFVAAALSWPRESRPQSCQLTDEGLDAGGELLRWKELSHATYGGRCCDPGLVSSEGTSPVAIQWDRGWIRLKPGELSPGRLYQRLWSGILEYHTPRLYGALGEIYARQSAQFSAEKVYASGLRPYSGGVMRAPTVGAWFLLSAFGFGTLWVDVRSPGIAVATVSIIVGLACLILYFMDQGKQTEREKVTDAGILISPGGLAIKQSKLQGEMTWSELQMVRLHPSPQKPRTLRLRLDGIEIVLQDEFELPLWYLYDRIAEAWTDARVRSETRANAAAPDPIAPAANDEGNPYAPPRSM